MNKLKSSLLWLWQLPQNLCGIIYKRVTSKSIISRINEDNPDYECYLKRGNGGVTLGKYIFVYQRYSNLEEVIKHESGHVKQSLILGPLYLLVIGLPSIIWAGFIHDLPWYQDKSYYWFYTEKWANKLAGINN